MGPRRDGRIPMTDISGTLPRDVAAMPAARGYRRSTDRIDGFWLRKVAMCLDAAPQRRQ